ncbi:MAG: ester cyclase [Chloroflexota bacterium]
MTTTQTLSFPTEQELSQMPEEDRQLWQNKVLVYNFFTRIINKRDLTAADQYLKEDYIQHNPGISTGREGFKAYFTNMFKSFSETTVHVEKILAEGNEVVLYCEHHMVGRLASLKMKTIDIFRLEDNLIAEHWDAVEGYGLKDHVLLSLQPKPNKGNSWYKVR